VNVKFFEGYVFEIRIDPVCDRWLGFVAELARFGMARINRMNTDNGGLAFGLWDLWDVEEGSQCSVHSLCSIGRTKEAQADLLPL
jgi:hypothetical protein